MRKNLYLSEKYVNIKSDGHIMCVKQPFNKRRRTEMDFYNVKKREHVKIADKDCEKVIYKRKTATGIQERYAAKAVDDDGTKLTKFLSKDAYDKLKCSVGKVAAKKK